MPIYFLAGDSLLFPDPEAAEPDGLLAVGGDLSLPRLVSAYAQGIFPWYGPDSPILWWTPDPRCVLLPQTLHVGARLARTLRTSGYHLTMDVAFDQVIEACAATPRPGQRGTWIVPAMRQAYHALHVAGLAHSVETWLDGELVGGLYGVSLGRAFFGESMFHRRPNASKAALVHLCRQLQAWGFELVDCQQTTPHMLAMGACDMPRQEFNRRLDHALRHPTMRGRWTQCGTTQPLAREAEAASAPC